MDRSDFLQKSSYGLAGLVLLNSCSDPVSPLDSLDKINGTYVITEGGRYGDFKSHMENPDSPSIYVDTDDPVALENIVMTRRGGDPFIKTNKRNYSTLTVKNVQALNYDTHPGHSPSRFLFLDRFAKIQATNNYMEGTAGMWIHMSLPGATATIKYNRAKNIDGRIFDGAGEYVDRELVQFVQFDKGDSMVDTEIAWNEIINECGRSRPEDNINMFKTSGTPSSPILIHNNYIEGAFPAFPEKEEYYGSFIMLGDHGGKYQVAKRNQGVITGNAAAGISGGENNEISNNRFVSSGVVRHPSKGWVPFYEQRSGIYIDNIKEKDAEGNIIPFGNNVAKNNRAAIWLAKKNTRANWWTNKIGREEGWIQNTMHIYPEHANNKTIVLPEHERREYQLWQKKLNHLYSKDRISLPKSVF